MPPYTRVELAKRQRATKQNKRILQPSLCVSQAYRLSCPCVNLYFVHAKSKSRRCEAVLGIRDKKTRMKVTPPLAVAPIAQEDDMQWNPNGDGIVFNP